MIFKLRKRRSDDSAPIVTACDTDRWLDELERLPKTNVAHELVIAALDGDLKPRPEGR